MKNVSDVQKNFDLDLEYGVEGENLMLSVFDGSKKVEVKTDRYGYRDWETDRKSTRLNSSHSAKSRMPSSA